MYGAVLLSSVTDYDVYQQCFQSGLLDAVHERCGDIPDGSWR